MPRSRKPIGPVLLGQLCGIDVERVEDALGDVVDLAHAVDLDEDAALAVDLDQRLGLLGVDLLAAPDDVLGVVGATVGLGALQQALRRAPPGRPSAPRRRRAVAGELDHPVELLDLGEGARVAVEQEAGPASGSSIRLRTIRLVTSSGTYSPASM